MTSRCRISLAGGQDGVVRRRGVVLIIVLVLVTMLALAGFGFLSAMTTEYEAARLNGHQQQARQTLASAESMLQWVLSLPRAQQRRIGGLRHNPGLFRGRLVERPTNAIDDRMPTPGTPGEQIPAAAATDEPDVRWRFAVVSAEETPEQGRVLRFGLRNESARLHLATVLRWDTVNPGAGRAALLQLPHMTESEADAILDWIDADDVAREFGAEAEHYQRLTQPCSPRNAIPLSLDELLYVRGITGFHLYGDIRAAGQSTATDAEQVASEETTGRDASADGRTFGVTETGIPFPGWTEYLTLHSSEANVSDSGQSRIRLNDPDLAALQQRLAEFLPEDCVRYILLARLHGLSWASDDGVAPSGVPLNTPAAPSYSLTSLCDLIGTTVLVPVPSGVIRVRSPLTDDVAGGAELYRSLADRTTTEALPALPGRVNVNEASETILRALPGVTPELASRIVSQRNMLDENTRSSPVWLLSEKLMDIAGFRRLDPEITCGGDVYSAEVIVFRAMGGPVLRRRLVMDGTVRPVARTDWIDLSAAVSPYPLPLLLPSPSDSVSDPRSGLLQ